MPTHIFKHIRNIHGQVIATVAMNKAGSFGYAVVHPNDRFNRSEAYLLASMRADKQEVTKIPDVRIIPHQFSKPSNILFTDVLSLPLKTLVQEAKYKLADKAKKVWG